MTSTNYYPNYASIHRSLDRISRPTLTLAGTRTATPLEISRRIIREARAQQVSTSVMFQAYRAHTAGDWSKALSIVALHQSREMPRSTLNRSA